MTTSVNYFTSSMPGAPALTATAGSLLNVLRFILTQESLLQTITLTVSSSVGTVTCANNPFSIGMNVQLRSQSVSELNTRKRVLTSSATQYTIDCSGIADGTYTDITHSTANLGWIEQFTTSDTAVFRSVSMSGSNCYLQVKDNSNYSATVRAFESMTDAFTGNKMFPRKEVLPTNSFWPKVGDLSATSKWVAIGDNKVFYIAIFADYRYQNNWYNTLSNWYGFGQFKKDHSIDAFNSFLNVSAVSTEQNYGYGTKEYSLDRSDWHLSNGLFLQNHHRGNSIGIKAGKALNFLETNDYVHPFGCAGRHGPNLSSFNGTTDDNVLFSPIIIRTLTCIRGQFYGILAPVFEVHYQNIFSDQQIIQLTIDSQTKKYICFRDGLSVMFFDLEGPWT